MKATYLFAAGALALTFGIAACVAGPDLPPPVIAPSPTVTAAPAPAPTPTPVPLPPVQEQSYANYLDAPQTPGDWSYVEEPGATFAAYGEGERFRFLVRCDERTRQVGLIRLAENRPLGPRMIEISTETTKRTFQSQPVEENPPLVAVQLSPSDPLLDAMAITKGRIAVGVEGERTLYMPAWVEISRVIEDCR